MSRARRRVVPTGSTWSAPDRRSTCLPSPRWSRRCATRPTCRCSCCCGSTTPGRRPAASLLGSSGWRRTTSAAVRAVSPSASWTPIWRSMSRSAPTSPTRCPTCRGSSTGPSTTPSTRDAPGAGSPSCPASSASAPRDRRAASRSGFDDLLALTSGDPTIARLLVAGGGLLAEQVPWLVRAGVRQFHLGRAGSPGRLTEGLRRCRPRPLLAAAARRCGRARPRPGHRLSR